MTPLLIGAGINQRYVVELTRTTTERYRFTVDAASATEAETAAWSRLFDGVPDESLEQERHPFWARARLLDREAA